MKNLPTHRFSSTGIGVLRCIALGVLVALGGCGPSSQTTSDTSPVAPPAAVSSDGDSSSARDGLVPTASSKVAPASLSPTRDNSNLLLGNPSAAGQDADNRLVERPQFALSYNKSQSGPNWVAWHLDKNDIGRVGRGSFWPDPLLPPDSQIRPNDYRGSGFDRGHQCPSGDRTSSRANNDATFVMSNMLPQAPALNQQVWAKLENYCRDQARAGNELYIVCGGSGTQGRIGGGKINVPAACWKVIVVLPQGDDDLKRINESTRVIAVLMPNRDTTEVGGARWNSFITTPAAIESATGYKFFSNLPAATRQALEQKKDSGRAPRGSGGSSGEGAVAEGSGGGNTEELSPSNDAETRSPTLEVPSPLPQESAPSVQPRAPTESQTSPADQAAGAQVWVNTRSGVYHYPGTRWYGNTKQGEYMSEQQAQSMGHRAAQNGQ